MIKNDTKYDHSEAARSFPQWVAPAAHSFSGAEFGATTHARMAVNDNTIIVDAAQDHFVLPGWPPLSRGTAL